MLWTSCFAELACIVLASRRARQGHEGRLRQGWWQAGPNVHLCCIYKARVSHIRIVFREVLSPRKSGIQGKFFLAGNCTRGTSCTFSHGDGKASLRRLVCFNVGNSFFGGCRGQHKNEDFGTARISYWHFRNHSCSVLWFTLLHCNCPYDYNQH